jgi:hypothetical protein
MQSAAMNPNLAEENLQTIRLLMERSALYRRALAPIMLLAGVMGLLAAGIGSLMHIDSTRAFGVFWLATATIVVTGAFLIARRQALKDSENFWSPPTRRVAQALSLPLSAGLVLGVLFTFAPANPGIDFTLLLPFLWALLYGCALHSAGAFILRGIRWFGWIYLIFASSTLGFVLFVNPNIEISDNCLMGIFFGGLHLAYGVYLYFTEKKNPAA